MLTAGDVNLVREVLHLWRSNPQGSRPGPHVVAFLDELAAAYSRVVALLEEWPEGETFVVITRGDLPRFPRAELRRALEGNRG